MAMLKSEWFRQASTIEASATDVPGSRVVAGLRAVPIDLFIVSVLTLAGAWAAITAAPIALRTGLGLPFVLFFPGYALAAAFFPRREGPDGVARIAISFALSLAIIPPLALAIDRSPWRIGQSSLAISLVLVTLTASMIATSRRALLPPAERFVPRIEPGLISPPRNWNRSTSIIVGLLAIAGLLVVAGGIEVVRTRTTGASLTEFALYNSAGQARAYPREVVMGQSTEVRFGVANHEGRPVSYILTITGAGVAVDPPPEIRLEDGEIWNGYLRFTVTAVGENLPVRFELRRADQSDSTKPYRLLQLVVEGVAPTAPSS